MIPCDLCGADDPRFVLNSPLLDGPLVECSRCGLRYVGSRHSQLTFGGAAAAGVVERVRAANAAFLPLRLEEEERLAGLNARWRLDLIREFRSGGRLLEVGCARGDFLSAAASSFEVFGVEPNPELAESAARSAAVHRDVIETLPLRNFDVAASFHVIEHVDSPKQFVHAIRDRLKPGGLLVLETPDIDSLPFRILKARWRQFIPEHYFFFDRRTMTKLLVDAGFQVERTMRVGKHASAGLVLNRLSRYWRPLRYAESAAAKVGLSSLTIRLNPLDILLVFAVRN